MGIVAMVQVAYYKVEALEGLLVAKGIIEANEVETSEQKLLAEEGKRRQTHREEFWYSIKDGDYIYFLHTGSDSAGEVVAKSTTHWKAITVASTVTDRWGRKKKCERTMYDVVPSEILVTYKDGHIETG
jgi:hypothetical protein